MSDASPARSTLNLTRSDKEEAWAQLRSLLELVKRPAAGVEYRKELDTIKRRAFRNMVVPGPAFALTRHMNEAAGQLREEDLRAICRVAGLGTLVVEPMLAHLVPICQGRLRRDSNSLRQVTVDPQEQSLADLPNKKAANIDFFVPTTRLANSEVYVVLARPRFGGKSAFHSHPGEELIFLLEGDKVELQFDSGECLQLEKFDFVHFYAERPHRVLNLSKGSACTVAIRFYQSRRGSYRGELLESINLFLRDRHQEVLHVKDLVRRILEEMTWPRTTAPSAGDRPVRDLLGLGRFLQQIAHHDFRPDLTVKNLALKSVDLGKRRSPAHFSRLYRGEIRQTQADFDELHSLYDVLPMLFWTYLADPVRPTVRIRGPRYDRDQCLDFAGSPDLEQVPVEEVSPDASSSEKTGYWFPHRRLADSDVAVQFVVLPPKATTHWNTHPGSEFLLLLEGVLEMEVENESTHVLKESHSFLHYDGKRPHQVKNPGSQPSVFLAIRFYEGSLATQSSRKRHYSARVLSLDPGKSTPPNQHPGQEIVLALDGGVEVQYTEPGQSAIKKVAENEKHVRFSGEWTHTLRNLEKTRSRVLVVHHSARAGKQVGRRKDPCAADSCD